MKDDGDGETVVGQYSGQGKDGRPEIAPGVCG